MGADETFEPVREPVNPFDVHEPKATRDPYAPYMGVPHQGGTAASRPAMASMPLMPQPMKSATTAWLLLAFVGGVGSHDFYLRDTGIGATKLIIGIISGVLSLVIVGWVGVFAIFCWNVVDAFRMNDRLRAVNAEIWQENQRLLPPGPPPGFPY